MKQLLFRIFLILSLGAVLKIPFEISLSEQRAHLKLSGTELTSSLRSNLSQNLALAILGGFRGIVADFVWLRAHSGWEEQAWFRMRENIKLAVVLQPHAISFWDIGAWHMAWNASYGESVNPIYPSDAYRRKMQRDWILDGKRFLEEGLKNNPESYDLYFKHGWLIYQKLNDPVGAIPSLKKASTYPEAPLYVGRMVGHMYEKAGDYRGAYGVWKALWLMDHNGYPQQLWYKIEKWGRACEEKLNIPMKERVFPFQSKPVKTPQHEVRNPR